MRVNADLKILKAVNDAGPDILEAVTVDQTGRVGSDRLNAVGVDAAVLVFDDQVCSFRMRD